MRHFVAKRKKLLLVLAATALVFGAALSAGALYVNSKMNLLARPAAASADAGESSSDMSLSLGTWNLDDIDVMENGGSIEPPEGDGMYFFLFT